MEVMAGKHYWTESGIVVGPMRLRLETWRGEERFDVETSDDARIAVSLWTADGKSDEGDDLDLVEEADLEVSVGGKKPERQPADDRKARRDEFRREAALRIFAGAASNPEFDWREVRGSIRASVLAANELLAALEYEETVEFVK